MRNSRIAAFAALATLTALAVAACGETKEEAQHDMEMEVGENTEALAPWCATNTGSSRIGRSNRLCRNGILGRRILLPRPELEVHQLVTPTVTATAGTSSVTMARVEILSVTTQDIRPTRLRMTDESYRSQTRDIRNLRWLVYYPASSSTITLSVRRSGSQMVSGFSETIYFHLWGNDRFLVPPHERVVLTLQGDIAAPPVQEGRHRFVLNQNGDVRAVGMSGHPVLVSIDTNFHPTADVTVVNPEMLVVDFFISRRQNRYMEWGDTNLGWGYTNPNSEAYMGSFMLTHFGTWPILITRLQASILSTDTLMPTDSFHTATASLPPAAVTHISSCRLQPLFRGMVPQPNTAVPDSNGMITWETPAGFDGWQDVLCTFTSTPPQGALNAFAINVETIANNRNVPVVMRTENENPPLAATILVNAGAPAPEMPYHGCIQGVLAVAEARITLQWEEYDYRLLSLLNPNPAHSYTVEVMACVPIEERGGLFEVEKIYGPQGLILPTGGFRFNDFTLNWRHIYDGSIVDQPPTFTGSLGQSTTTDYGLAEITSGARRPLAPGEKYVYHMYTRVDINDPPPSSSELYKFRLVDWSVYLPGSIMPGRVNILSKDMFVPLWDYTDP